MRFWSVAEFKQIVTGLVPGTGSNTLYPKSDDKFYSKNAAGTEVLVGPQAIPTPGVDVGDEGLVAKSAATFLDFTGAGVVAEAHPVNLSGSRIVIPGTPIGAAGGHLTGTYPSPNVIAQQFTDSRGVATIPNDYNPAGVGTRRWNFKQSTTIGIPDGSTYSFLVGFRGYGDQSGGNAWEYAHTGNGNVYRRTGATTTWGAWQQVEKNGTATMFTDTVVTESQLPARLSNGQFYYSNLDSGTITGWFYTSPSTLNLPAGATGYGVGFTSMRYSPTDGCAMILYDISDGRSWSRVHNGTIWMPWVQQGTPSGAAGGDLSGTYPNPTIGIGKVVTWNRTAADVGDSLLLNGNFADLDGANSPIGWGASDCTLSGLPFSSDVNYAYVANGVAVGGGTILQNGDTGKMWVSAGNTYYVEATVVGDGGVWQWIPGLYYYNRDDGYMGEVWGTYHNTDNSGYGLRAGDALTIPAGSENIHYARVGLKFVNASKGYYVTRVAVNRVIPTARIKDSAVTIPKLSATGTPDSTTFLRGDNTWAVPAGGGSGAASADTLPVGSVVQWAGDTAPPGYLLCDGTAVNRYTYASLFAVIATKYGVGDGANTFNLPNMKGKVAVGRDAADTSFDVLGETGGAKTHTHGVTINDHSHGIPDHSHGVTGTANFYVTNVPSGGNQSLARDTHYHTIPNQSLSTYGIGTAGGNLGSADSQSTLQPYLVLNYIIKAAPTTGGGADEVWIGPGAPTDLSTELWYDTDA